MKRIALFLLSLLTMCSFTSCVDSSDDYAKYSIFGITRGYQSEWHIQSDDNKNLYVGDDSYLTAYQVTDGQRVIVQYDDMQTDKVPTGYDKVIKVYGITDIPWGSTETIFDEDEIENIGTEPVELLDGNFISATRRLLNMNISFQASMSSGNMHEFTLVKVNDPDYAPMDTDEGYINFELVHDPGEDKMANTYSYYGWISWDLQAYNLIYENEDLATAKGVIVGMTNLQGKKVYYRAKFMD